MIDSHCHLDLKEYHGNLEETINNARREGVEIMVNIGADMKSSEKSVALAEKYDCIYATVGVHPHDASKYDPPTESGLLRLLQHKKTVAIGEIGLDYYRDLSPRAEQRRVFLRQLEIAVRENFPVVIHSRDSFRDTVGALKDYYENLPGGIFHCFPGTIDEAFEVIDMGFHISVGGVITYPKAKMAEVAAAVPLDKILLETDSPYLTPVPFRGQANQPAYVKYICAKLAELQGISFAEAEKITDRNCRKVYRLVETFGG
ncbi:Uncharacterized deoxyribonuclease YabD [Candidatus Zixiibacteriota bacterium]|nr:Uncharacterized deoxyribonuclease YabD [candidate division Zixibacteria bacterium]